jgi:hypothetical protein
VRRQPVRRGPEPDVLLLHEAGQRALLRHAEAVRQRLPQLQLPRLPAAGGLGGPAYSVRVSSGVGVICMPTMVS